MKKSLILLTIILVVIAAVSLTACGGGPAPQSMLMPPWNNYDEVLTFDVADANNNILGEFEVSFKNFKGVSYNIDSENIAYNELKPAFSHDNFHGYIIDSTLTLNDGSSKRSVAITNMQFVPMYSFATSNFVDKNPNDESISPEKLDLEYKYNEKTISYKAKGNDVFGAIDLSGDIKCKPFAQIASFDNALYIALSRTMPLRQASISFVTPSFRDGSLSKRVATNTTEFAEIAPSGDINVAKFNQPELKEDKSLVSCHKTIIASGETMPGSGTPIVYYFSSVPYNVTEGVRVDHLLLKFEEHGIIYTLKDVNMYKVA